jgi:hypothetical protein
MISIVTGSSIDDNLFRWLSGTTSAVVIIVLVFEKWIWRWSIFRVISELFGTPVLHGTWKGTLEYERDGDGKRGSVDIYAVIDQTLTSISVRSFFKKPSESDSTIAKIEKIKPNRKRLIYLYKNEAPFGKREGNPPHDGACVLEVVGFPTCELSGSYFTERKGAGLVKLKKYNPRLAETLEGAEKLEYFIRPNSWGKYIKTYQ